MKPLRAIAIATDPVAKKVIEAAYLDHMLMTADQFAALVEKDAARWKKIVHDSGVQQ